MLMAVPVRHQACRFLFAYSKAPEIGVVGKIALSLAESTAATERDPAQGKS